MPGPIPYSVIPRSDFLAPVCRVNISFDGESVDWDAIIDSGADVTCIPEWIAVGLSLGQVTDFEVAGVKNPEDNEDSHVKTRPGYLVDFEFLGFPYRALLVAGLDEPTDYVLIGRDILRAGCKINFSESDAR